MPRAGHNLSEIELGGYSAIYEERGKYMLRNEEEFPDYREITSLDELRDPSRVAADLRQIDWSFTDDKTGFLSHDLHPYPAKFIPQIPGHCITRLTLPGELVLDPFGGSGTTALEAVRLGRRALSIDANPVGTLIGRVKTCNLDRSTTRDLHTIRSSLTTLSVDLPSPKAICETYSNFIPDIPNIDKWFPISSRGELALIRDRIGKMESEKARDIASLALSRIVLAASYQDSETRYSSRPRNIPQGETIARYLVTLDTILQGVIRTQPALRYGIANFVTSDSRRLNSDMCLPGTVDLIVTSPPYGNANDYHLYHRFRLLWLGHDPKEFGRIEIGSHLRHQRESSGFEEYASEMDQVLKAMFALLRPGRFAVLVIGDAMYERVVYPAAQLIGNKAEKIGFELVCIIEREIHSTKRSFTTAGRRATTEKLLIIRKPSITSSIWLVPPVYRLWPYEEILRKREIEALVGIDLKRNGGDSYCLNLDTYTLSKIRRLVFTHYIGASEKETEPTWQAIIENGLAAQLSWRKDPKYVTHSLHPYKGKFYPQLAKGLMNLGSLTPGAIIFDPFCGSGTTLLEGYLNGFKTFGCDMNPLAAKIARAKTNILDMNPDVVREAVAALVSQIENMSTSLPPVYEHLPQDCMEEISSWFPAPVIAKLNWLLGAIRSVSEGIVRDFLEVVLSSIIREVSQQDPNDLRIRRRKQPIYDANVFQLYLDVLDIAYGRLAKFWSIRGFSPTRFLPSRVIEGDSRNQESIDRLGLRENMVDLVLTSPPYATALPYIDTDRLSLLLLFGMDSSMRRPIEYNLIGSREIVTNERRAIEKAIELGNNELPTSVQSYLQDLIARIEKEDIGFRRKNMPALLHRFFLDIKEVLQNCHRVLRANGEAMLVIGDNKMRVERSYERIPTTDLVRDIATECGMGLTERIDISVTTENLNHIKNAITENAVLRLRKLE